MHDIFEWTARWGVETSHYDGLGQLRHLEPAVLVHILDAIDGC
jgi:hypothetical protein